MKHNKDGVYDFVIIGAGFFGLNIAKYLESKLPNSKILILEKEKNKLMRASRWNQSRVHSSCKDKVLTKEPCQGRNTRHREHQCGKR